MHGYTTAHRVAREDPIHRMEEQQRDTIAHRVAREDPVHRMEEQQRDTIGSKLMYKY